LVRPRAVQRASRNGDAAAAAEPSELERLLRGLTIHQYANIRLENGMRDCAWLHFRAKELTGRLLNVSVVALNLLSVRIGVLLIHVIFWAFLFCDDGKKILNDIRLKRELLFNFKTNLLGADTMWSIDRLGCTYMDSMQ
jgi:hypothetical protein